MELIVTSVIEALTARVGLDGVDEALKSAAVCDLEEEEKRCYSHLILPVFILYQMELCFTYSSGILQQCAFIN